MLTRLSEATVRSTASLIALSAQARRWAPCICSANSPSRRCRSSGSPNSPPNGFSSMRGMLLLAYCHHRDRAAATGEAGAELDQRGERDDGERRERDRQIAAAPRRVALEQVVEVGGGGGEAADERLPEPERVLLQQHVVGARDPKAAALDQRLDSARGEVRAVARDVEVVPARGAEAGLEARKVRDSDQQHASGAQPGRDPLERRARLVEMLKDVP